MSAAASGKELKWTGLRQNEATHLRYCTESEPVLTCARDTETDFLDKTRAYWMLVISWYNRRGREKQVPCRFKVDIGVHLEINSH